MSNMDKHLQFKAFDFAEDPGFINWVQSNFEDNNNYWKQLLSNHPNLKSELDEAIELVKLFDGKDMEMPVQRKENLLDRIHSTIDKEEEEIAAENATVSLPNEKPSSKSKGGIRRWLLPLAGAAAVIGLILINLLSLSDAIVEETGLASTKNFQLPDASSVVLNAVSNITYDKNFEKERVLFLEGEAFFEVKKGSKFSVKTKNGTVNVLGTAFNVFSRDQIFEVECVHGKVEVTNPNGANAVILTLGEKAHFDGAGKLKKVEAQKDSDWTKGEYHFVDRPFHEVMEEFERQFNVTFSIPQKFHKEIYNGFFEKSDLNKALKSIGWPLGLELKMDGKKIIVSNEKN